MRKKLKKLETSVNKVYMEFDKIVPLMLYHLEKLAENLGLPGGVLEGKISPV